MVFVEGEVYLRTFDPNGALLGPFKKESNGDFSYEEPPGYFHSVSSSTEGEWWYSWSYVHMSGDPVDASELALANQGLSE